MKKWTIMLIVLLISFCACAGVWAESPLANESREAADLVESPVEDFECSIADGEVTITKYVGSDADVVVPATIEGLPVTVIGEKAFSYNSQLENVYLPDTVHTIGAFAFAFCKGLETFTLPEGLLTIGKNAFEYCTSLKSLKLPGSLQTLGGWAFNNSGLTDINIPKRITKLPEYCFYGCPFETFTIPEHVTSIDQCALAYTGLKSIVVPESVTEFGAYLFCGCTKLTEVTLPSNMTQLPMCAFTGCTSLESITLPDSIWAFGVACFGDCTNLKEINLPANLQHVPSCAFGGSSLETESVARVISEVIKPGMTDFEKALALHDWLIYNADYDTECGFHSAAGVLFFGRGVCQSYADAYAMLLSAVGIPHTQVTSSSMDHTWNMLLLDGDWYHVDCTWDDPTGGGQENHLYFGLSDELMRQDHTWESPEYYPSANGTRYQYGVDNAPSATPTPTAQPIVTPAPTAMPAPTPAQPESALGDFTYSIADGAVTITEYKGSDANVVVPATIEGKPVTVIGRGAFGWNERVTTVSLPASVHTIQEDAFHQCSNLTAVYGTENVVVFGRCAFANCSKLSCININTYNDIQEFGYACFENCALPAMVLGQPADSPHLMNIQETYCYGEDITMCFFSVENGEAALVDAHWGGSNQKWHLNVPSTYRGMPVTAVAHNSVSDDWTIGSLTLPDSIRTIGENAFNNCIELKATIYTGGIVVWRYAFGNSPGVTIKQETDPAFFDYTISNGEVTINKYTGSKTTVVIPETIEGLPVTAIGEYAFAGYTGLNSITLTRDLTMISQSRSLQSSQRPTLSIPASVTDIGNYAFAGCSDLQDVKLPDQLESVGAGAFSGIEDIDIMLPANIQHIGASAFGGYPQTLPTMDCPTAFALAENQSGNDSQYKVVGQEEFLITAGKNAQGEKTFTLEDVTATGNVEIPDGITAISSGVQQRINDGSITTMSIPDSVQKIDLQTDGTNQSFTIQCSPGSMASSWATENGVSWQPLAGRPGDANGDGQVNAADALAILQYSAGWDVTVDTVKADVTGDGMIGISDALKILQDCMGGDIAKALRALQRMLADLNASTLEITEHPVDHYATVGESAAFTVTATGEELRYQWYINRNGRAEWTLIPGATSSTYTIENVSIADDSCRYYCAVTSADGMQVISNEAALHVTPTVELPITGDAANPLVWLILMAASLTGMLLLTVFSRKRLTPNIK